MSRKAKFYFNPSDLTYVQHKPNRLEKMLLLAGICASFLLSAILVYSIYIYHKQTPNEFRLKEEVSLYRNQLKQLNGKFEKVGIQLSDLELKDNEIYRTIFEADPLSSEATGAGTG